MNICIFIYTYIPTFGIFEHSVSSHIHGSKARKNEADDDEIFNNIVLIKYGS